MDASPTRLIEYLDGTKQNVVPLFQRPYTWDTKNWQTFWDDLLDCCGSERPYVHFLGAVVTTPVNSVPVGVGKNLVIDGQQRLTTVSLLLAAVRDLAEGPLRERLQDLLVNRHYDGGDRLKLVPTHADRDDYRRIVDGEAFDEKSRIGRGYLFFRQQVQAAAAEGPDVQTLHERLGRSLQVVGISLAESDDPYLIFESLNHKGVSLTEADLVRNTVLMRFPHAIEADGVQAQVHERLWLPVEAAVGEKGLSEFLRHAAMIDGSDVRKAGIYTAWKRRFDAIDGPDAEDRVREEMRRLLRLAWHYRRFVRPDEEPDPRRRRVFAAIDEVRSTVGYPLLLALHDAADRGRLAPERLTGCLEWVESFVVRRLLCHIATNALRRLFIFWCRRLAELPEDADAGAALRNAMLAGERSGRWPSDDDLRHAVTTLPQYGGRGGERLVLARLEAAQGHKEPAELAGCTVEHVMPQTLSPAWHESLGADADRLHAEAVGLLGNLTLSAYNSEMGNQPFAAKRNRLAASNLATNRRIAESPKWGPEQIAARGQALAEQAIALWPRPQTDGRTMATDEPLVCTGPHAEGRGRLEDGGIRVLAGSLCRRESVPSARSEVERLREPLFGAGVLEPAGADQLRFARDHRFDSPSGAAMAILGRTANGWMDWQTPTGRTLKSLAGSR